MLGSILLLFDFFRARWREGPRPLAIHAFALFMLATGLFTLIDTLPSYSLWEEQEDKVIGAFTLFTIVLIPIVAIWGFGSRFARMLMCVPAVSSFFIVLLQIYSALSPDPFDPLVLAHAFGMMCVVAGLFHGSVYYWFNPEKKGLPDPQLDF